MAEDKRVVWLQSVGHFVRPMMRVNIILSMLKLLPYEISIDCLRVRARADGARGCCHVDAARATPAVPAQTSMHAKRAGGSS
jgi:hypothetical protein